MKERKKTMALEKSPSYDDFNFSAPMHNVKERKMNFMLLAPMFHNLDKINMNLHNSTSMFLG